MDALTHTLFAIILGRAGLNRLAPRATLLLVVAANLPDVDIIARLGNQAAWLRYWRRRLGEWRLGRVFRGGGVCLWL
jgi:inner membrane protein